MGHEEQLPQCYVRVDVAHIIKIFCRNKHLSGIKNKQLKEFYIRGIRLLITCCEINEFEEILISLLTIIMSETNGLDEDKNITASEECKNKILNLIKGTPVVLEDKMFNDEETKHSINEHCIVDSFDEEEEIYKGISAFLRKIELVSHNNSKIIETSLSGYWAPELMKDVLRICKDFPLWTSLMKRSFESIYTIPSSASVESDFGDLKRKILRYDIQPMTADGFVIKHLKAIDNNTKLFRSKQLRHDLMIENDKCSHEDDINVMNKLPENKTEKSLLDNVSDASSDSEISEGTNEIHAYENWRGLGESDEIESNIKKN